MKLGSKQKQQQLHIVRALIVLVVLLIVWLGVSVFKRYEIERDMAGRREVLQAEKDALEVRKAGLRERVQYLEAEQSVEAEIRRSFDVAREGEQVVIILDNDVEPVVKELPAVIITKPWYKFW